MVNKILHPTIFSPQNMFAFIYIFFTCTNQTTRVLDVLAGFTRDSFFLMCTDQITHVGLTRD
jgi:hypothetical protein